MIKFTDTEQSLLLRIVEEVADARENHKAPQYRSVQFKLTVPEVVALRPLTAKLRHKTTLDLSPKHSCL